MFEQVIINYQARSQWANNKILYFDAPGNFGALNILKGLVLWCVEAICILQEGAGALHAGALQAAGKGQFSFR